ncbi:mitochondrial distribution and morphology protein 10 [Diutina catenulata]
MYTYMEYLQKCFYKATNWNEDNIFSHLTATSQALLEFPIANGFKLDVSSQSTPFSASSFTLSNYRAINGSLAYFYSSCPLYNTNGTSDISLQDAISGFKIIEPIKVDEKPALRTKSNPMLMYGRMYFPGSALEAMVIKRFTPTTQVLIKCISNPQLDKNGTMIVYLQTNKAWFSREFIYSTNEALLGMRFLYNFTDTTRQGRVIPKFDNSVVSIGTELWYAAKTLSPGLSTSLRYSTRSTSTGKPLTMTVAINPILGHIQSTYTVKTSVASTFCSKYDFNIFSYASNLSLGFELFNFSGGSRSSPSGPQLPRKQKPLPAYILPGQVTQNSVILNPIQGQNDSYYINPNLIDHPRPQREDVTTAFQNMVNASNFSSVFKCSTSLNDRSVKFLWEGHVKDFLMSTGVKIDFSDPGRPDVARFGVTFSYAA